MIKTTQKVVFFYLPINFIVLIFNDLYNICIYFKNIFCIYKKYVYICTQITISKKIEIMNTELDEILDSEEFNAMYDFEAEKKEIEAAGWTYAELLEFGKAIAKAIK